MTHEMLTLFNGAQYAGTVLTGRLTGVERIPLGIVANVSYNKNDGTLNLNYSRHCLIIASTPEKHWIK